MTVDKEANKKMMIEVYEKRKAAKSAPALTVEVYQDLKAKKLSDAKIMKQYNLNNVSFYEWKHANGLVKTSKPVEDTPVTSQQATQEPETAKPMNDTKTVGQAKYDDLWTKYKTLELKYNAAVQDLDDAKAELIEESNLRAAIQSESTDELQSALHENKRLKNYEKDYRNLEIDYRNLNTENERLKRMLGRLKNTERMNLWMMEHYVDMHKQVDEVLG